MRNLTLGFLLAGAATALTACATYSGAPATAANTRCGTYGYIDVNNDGWITGDEWNTYRTNAYGYWDVNKDGRISRTEFENCWRGGGFYRDAYYNPSYWNNYWTAFDANNDGYLSADEYWSAQAWTRIDANGNGRIDSNEWVWWPK
jgi:hypothetical protein